MMAIRIYEKWDVSHPAAKSSDRAVGGARTRAVEMEQPVIILSGEILSMAEPLLESEPYVHHCQRENYKRLRAKALEVQDQQTLIDIDNTVELREIVTAAITKSRDGAIRMVDTRAITAVKKVVSRGTTRRWTSSGTCALKRSPEVASDCRC
jgi:hypothetical protein